VDTQLLKKYFRNQCTLDEIEKVMDWFQTEEGTVYFEERLDRDMQRYAEEENLLLYPEVPSEKMLHHIERVRKKGKSRSRSRDRWWMRVAIVLLISCGFAGGSFWILQDTVFVEEQASEAVYRTISTLDDQQRLITLADGTQIRLNANSAIEIPEQFPVAGREVRLKGEAFFEVATDENRPFSILAGRAMIRVLGTQFNVRVDEHARKVQVAVAEGMVSLSDEANGNSSEAILRMNTFAEFNLDDGEILIEQSPVNNYLSWFSGSLYFYDEPLWIVSRYLERLYGVAFRFEEEQLRELSLSTNIMKRDLVPVLDILSQTLGIDYRVENETVYWMENR
jgi:transmembrane sensor